LKHFDLSESPYKSEKGSLLTIDELFVSCFIILLYFLFPYSSELFTYSSFSKILAILTTNAGFDLARFFGISSKAENKTFSNFAQALSMWLYFSFSFFLSESLI
jgi:hypothetical protein